MPAVTSSALGAATTIRRTDGAAAMRRTAGHRYFSTPVMTTPRMNARWARKNTTTGTAIVIDAADLSLNISREILQQDRQIQLIRKRLVKKVLSTVRSMMDADAEKRIKAVTVCFTDLEGRLHMLDYDKKFLLKSADNLTFDGSSIRGFSRQQESDLRLAIDWPAFYWLPSDIFGPGKVLAFAFLVTLFVGPVAKAWDGADVAYFVNFGVAPGLILYIWGLKPLGKRPH